MLPHFSSAPFEAPTLRTFRAPFTSRSDGRMLLHSGRFVQMRPTTLFVLRVRLSDFPSPLTITLSNLEQGASSLTHTEKRTKK